MKHMIEFQAKTDATAWLLSLSVNGKKTRVRVVHDKIRYLYRRAEGGDVASILQLQKWSMAIRQSESYLKKENHRLDNFIQRRLKESLVPCLTSTICSIPVSNPIDYSFLRLIRLYDELCAKCAICHITGLITKKRGLANKVNHYQKHVLRILMDISQAKTITKEVSTRKILAEEEKELIALARNNPALPTLNKPKRTKTIQTSRANLHDTPTESYA
jgi:hypothetical protein